MFVGSIVIPWHGRLAHALAAQAADARARRPCHVYRGCPSVVALPLVASSSQLIGYLGSSICIACGVMYSGRSVSNITANSSVRVAFMLAMIVPGCGPCGMPAGWWLMLPALMPLREPK